MHRQITAVSDMHEDPHHLLDTNILTQEPWAFQCQAQSCDTSLK